MRHAAKLLEADMVFDARALVAKEKDFLRSLVEAADYMDQAFRRQMGVGPDEYPEEDMRPALYPQDLTREEFEAYVEKHPERRAALLSPYTVIRRRGRGLQATPYHETYQEFMEPAAKALWQAAGLTDNPSLARFLKSKAQALTSDDYYQSDVDWINLKGNTWDLTIGPYEVYRDALMGLKAFYMSVVEKVDREESNKLYSYLKYLDMLEAKLPYPQSLRPQGVKLTTAFAVVHDIYRAGEILYGYQAVAENLPNDPKVLSEYGSKKTFYKDIMDLKSQQITQPTVREVIAEDQVAIYDPQIHFLYILFHEIAHALGPRYAEKNGQRLTLHEALKDRYSALEECKADVVGFYAMHLLFREGVFSKEEAPAHRVAYLAQQIKSIRFGTKEAHGLGSFCQLNHHLRSGAITFDEEGRFRVDPARLPDSVAQLVERILHLQATGDYDGVGDFFKELGKPTLSIEKALKKAAYLAVDVRPTYRILWE